MLSEPDASNSRLAAKGASRLRENWYVPQSQAGRRRLERLVRRISEERDVAKLPGGRVQLSLTRRPKPPGASNMAREEFLDRVAAAQVC